MTIDDLKSKIKPEIESMFGSTMTNVIFTNARVKVMNEGKGLDEQGKCKLFLECIGGDEKVVGMLGAAGAKSKVIAWMSYVR